VDEALGGI